MNKKLEDKHQKDNCFTTQRWGYSQGENWPLKLDLDHFWMRLQGTQWHNSISPGLVLVLTRSLQEVVPFSVALLASLKQPVCVSAG